MDLLDQQAKDAARNNEPGIFELEERQRRLNASEEVVVKIPRWQLWKMRKLKKRRRAKQSSKAP